MTLPRSETPLRRSAVATHRESMMRDITTIVNDDEAERQEARRRTILQQQTHPRDSSVLESIEENETIRACLEMYNGNKLSRENAWNMSLIDTLSNLLERHHKTVSNFKMAGSSLEASSKVYGLRVDSIYLDALRMSAGLNARSLTEQQLNAAADRDDSFGDNAGATVNNGEPRPSAPLPKVKKRRAVATVTKNKDTINSRLETAPMHDPVFGKLNSTVGSINASNRLMHNILPTVNSELRLRTTYRFWNADELLAELKNYTQIDTEIKKRQPLVSAAWAKKLLPYVEQLKLRPLHTGYIISDAPNSSNNIQQLRDDDMGVDSADNFYENPQELSMAFDINAECEPMPDLNALAPPTVLEIDYNEMEELTAEERSSLQHCRLLRKQPLIIDDLRPVDGTTNLEYSYRPMDQISQFWAGPSHWKFKRPRNRTTFAQVNTAQDHSGTNNINPAARRGRRAAQQAAKRRSDKLNFSVCDDSLFLPIEANAKVRKVNYQKRWDTRKLMLPTKFEFPRNYFYKYEHAPSFKVSRRFGVPDDDKEDNIDRDEHLVADSAAGDDDLFDNDHFSVATPNSPEGINVSSMQLSAEVESTMLGNELAACNNLNDTVLEIATDFEGAPTQVTKVIVPFAKRAKVIDMKNLKRSCNSLIQKQLLTTVSEEQIPRHPQAKNEQYAKGMATFNEVYNKLPSMLTPKMVDSLSPSVALYAVLHLANDMKLRLIPQDDNENFIIRQLAD